MLSDPDSAIIRRFGLLNEAVPADNVRDRGIPHPGTFLVDAAGVVRGKFFEEHYVNRVTMPTMLAREFGVVLGRRAATTHLDHVDVTALAVQDRVHPGNRLMLIARVAPAQGAHVYAPGAERFGYRPVTLTVEAPPHCTVHPPRYPDAEALRLPGEDEPVPAYTRPVEIQADLVLGNRQDLADAVTAGHLTVRGRLAAQACDETACYPPQEAAVTWEFEVATPDTERVPEPLRRESRKPGPAGPAGG